MSDLKNYIIHKELTELWIVTWMIASMTTFLVFFAAGLKLYLGV